MPKLKTTNLARVPLLKFLEHQLAMTQLIADNAREDKSWQAAISAQKGVAAVRRDIDLARMAETITDEEDLLEVIRRMRRTAEGQGSHVAAVKLLVEERSVIAERAEAKRLEAENQRAKLKDGDLVGSIVGDLQGLPLKMRERIAAELLGDPPAPPPAPPAPPGAVH